MKRFSKNYIIDYYQVGADRSLTLQSLMNIIQDIASDHAKILGFGQDELDVDTFWVLVRLQLQMSKLPQWRDEIRLETYISNQFTGTPPREVLIYADNELIGKAQTSWLVLSAETRKPATQKIDELLEAGIDESCGVVTRKINLSGHSLSLVREFEVLYSDLDLNYHVNNAIYGKWVSDSVPVKYWKDWQLHEFGINFMSEVHLGQKVVIKSEVKEEDDILEILVSGSVAEKEKAAFAASIKLTKRI